MLELDAQQQEINKINARSIKYAYDVEGNLEYKGYNMVPNAAISDDTWWVNRYYYDIDENLIETKWDKGSWEDRTNLNWE